MRRAPWVLLLAAHVASADSDPAVELAMQAEQAVAAGDFDAAATKFRAAYAADPRPEFLCNTGVAYHRAKVWPKAELYLTECMQHAAKLDATFVGQLRTAVRTVRGNLQTGQFAPVEVIVQPADATISFDGERLAGTHVVWLPFGDHELVIESAGHVAVRREVVVDSQVARQVRVTLPVAKEVVAPPRRRDRVAIDQQPETPRRSLTVPVIASVLAAASGVVAVIEYRAATRAADDAASTQITRAEYADLIDGAKSHQHRSWAFAGLAVVGGAVSGYLWHRALRSVDVVVSPRGTAVSISATW